MKRAILGTFILAVIVAAFTATQAEAQDSPTLGVMERLQEMQEDLLVDIADNITVRPLNVEHGYAVGSHHRFDPDEDTITIDPLTGFVFVSMGYRSSQSTGFRVYLDHKRLLDVAPPEDDGFNGRHRWFIVNRINIVFGLDEPVAFITRSCQDNWYWGVSYHEREGYPACPPGGDPGGWQSVPPTALGPELFACSSVEKRCTIDPVTNEEHCPLVCVQKGWVPPE